MDKKNSHTVTKKDVIDALKKCGLNKGDSLIVHSSLSSIGKVESGADTIIDAILEVIGPDGMLIAPTFEDEDEEKVFDIRKSETNLGIIPTKIWKRPGAKRSRHPLANVAAIGKNAEWLLKNHAKAKTAHGQDTPYHRLSQIGGKILLIGVDQDRNTFLHVAETLAKLPYLKPQKGKYKDHKGHIKEKSWALFPGPHRNFISLQSWMESKKIVKKTKIGNSLVQLIEAKPLLEQLLGRLQNEPDLFISPNPNLPDGIWQKVDLFKQKWKKENFKLAADSQYAGRYFDEIIDNMSKYGIENILLSYINNVPWNNIEEKKRKWYLQGLRQAKIKVAGLRMLALDTSKAIDLLKQAKTSLLTVIATTRSETIVRLSDAGFTVLLENTALQSDRIQDLMTSLKKKNVSFAFNPVEFTKLHENPFLKVYTKTKLRYYTHLLYVNDGLYTGERTLLEEGLAEIKELISAFRCRSYDGFLALQGPGPAQFCQTVEKFFLMLKELGDVSKNY